jgi:hypothetical protein
MHYTLLNQLIKIYKASLIRDIPLLNLYLGKAQSASTRPTTQNSSNHAAKIELLKMPTPMIIFCE